MRGNHDQIFIQHSLYNCTIFSFEFFYVFNRPEYSVYDWKPRHDRIENCSPEFASLVNLRVDTRYENPMINAKYMYTYTGRLLYTNTNQNKKPTSVRSKNANIINNGSRHRSKGISLPSLGCSLRVFVCLLGSSCVNAHT